MVGALRLHMRSARYGMRSDPTEEVEAVERENVVEPEMSHTVELDPIVHELM